MELSNLYSEYYSPLYAYVRRRIASKEDAEDILHNVFTRLSANDRGFSKPIELQNWIYTVVRNAVIDYYRSNARKKLIALTETHAETITEDSLPEATSRLALCLEKLLSLMPKDYQQILIDSEIKGIKQKELAEKYNMSYSSVRSRVQRGRRRLRKLIQEYYDIKIDAYGNIVEAMPRTALLTCGQPSLN